MRALFVTPVEEGSGETITSIHVAECLVRRGWEVAFLGSAFALRFLPATLPARVYTLGSDGAENVAAWEVTLRDLRPDLVVFADYALMFFQRGSVPLARVPGWTDSLAHVDARLATMDHFGFSGGTDGGLFLGPPHFGIAFQEFPALPDGMDVLLPCPMHEPGDVPGRVGIPFRYWDVPLGLTDVQRAETRRRWLGDDPRGLLVFHSVPSWAAQYARKLGLSFYEFLPDLLEHYFAPLADRVRIVSVNDGNLLHSPSFHVENLTSISRMEFEALLFSADLVLTENGLSISVGKAVCARQVAAVLRNSLRLPELMERAEPLVRGVLSAMEARQLGSIYPYEAFPTVTPRDLDAIGIYRGNSLAGAFARLEVFGGSETTKAITQLLTDDRTRQDLVARQQQYIDALARLDDVADIVERLVT